MEPDCSGDACKVANMTEMRKSKAKESEVNHRFVEHAQWYGCPIAWYNCLSTSANAFGAAQADSLLCLYGSRICS